MPEESLETGELQEKLDQAIEKAEEAAEKRASPSWTFQLSLSTAIIAVLAAIASSKAGTLINEALLCKNEAGILQTKASDQWAYYQAKGIKGIMYETQAQAVAGRSALAAKFSEETARYKKEQADIKAGADDIEKKSQEKNEESDHFLEYHERFSSAVTFFQVAIALAAMAALTRRKPLWVVGLVIAAVGLFYFIRGFL